MPPTVAIDTNSINVRQENVHLNQLEEWHKAGLIDIRRTSTLAAELAADRGAWGENRRQKAEKYKEGGTSRAFTMRQSTLRGGDSLRGPTVHEWIDPITEIIFPGKDFKGLGARERGDILHLATCKLHGWGYFVTLDEKHILRHAEQLWRQLGIRALTPKDAVREIAKSLGEGIGQPS